MRSVLALLLLWPLSLLVLNHASGPQPAAPQGASGKPAAPPTEATSAPPDKRIPRGSFYEPEPLDFNDHQGFVSIFDGQSLTNWDGDPAVWRVENGSIVSDLLPQPHPAQLSSNQRQTGTSTRPHFPA